MTTPPTRIALGRHGETDWNRRHRIQGMTDIPLNDTGREQARATGRLLARRNWDRVFASPLSRALETAAIIADELGLPEPEVVQALAERDYGAAEGMSFAEIDRTYGRNGDVPGQEPRAAVMARVIPALHDLAARYPGAALLAVSHGGAIRSAMMSADPGSSHGVITNGSVHSFELREGGLRLVAFDDPLDEVSSQLGESLDAQNAVEARDDEGAA